MTPQELLTDFQSKLGERQSWVSWRNLRAQLTPRQGKRLAVAWALHETGTPRKEMDRVCAEVLSEMKAAQP